MQGLRNLDRLSVIVLLGTILAVGVFFTGCGQAAQTDKKASTGKAPAVSVTPVKPAGQNQEQKAVAPKAANQSGSSSLARPEIEKCETLIQLHEKEAEIAKNGAIDKETSAVIAAQRKALIDKAKVVSFDGKIDVLDADIKMTAPDKAVLKLLVRANVALESDYKIGVNASVKKDFKSFLSPSAEVEKLRERIVFWPSPASTKWKVGEEILLTTNVGLKPIPYLLSVGFYANKPPHQLGEQLSIGWYGDVKDK